MHVFDEMMSQLTSLPKKDRLIDRLMTEITSLPGQTNGQLNGQPRKGDR